MFFSLFVIAVTLSSCNTIVKKFSGLTSNDLTTDSIVFHKDAEHATVHFYVDFPTDGNKLLVNAVQEYINEQLGGTYTGNQSEAQPMLDYYGEDQWDSLKVEYQDMTADGDTDWMSDVSLYADKSIRKVYETEKIVTYVTQILFSLIMITVMLMNASRAMELMTERLRLARREEEAEPESVDIELNEDEVAYLTGGGVRYTVPSKINIGALSEQTHIRFRVTGVYKNVSIVIRSGETEILRRKSRILVPSEMLDIILKKEKLENVTEDISVFIEEVQP